MNIALDAVQQRVAGDQPSRTRSLLTAMMIGTAAAVLTYRVLRRDNKDDDEDKKDDDESPERDEE
jgi:hypothetical protein